jgi:hypothetical protein
MTKERTAALVGAGPAGLTLARPVFKQKALLVALSLILPAILVAVYFQGLGPVRRGSLADSDCYMRLVRVGELYRRGRWYDATVDRANVPYGEVLHWTRPLDALLLGGAAIATLATDFETGLFLGAVILSPALLAATLLGLIWSSRPLLSKSGPFLAALLIPGSLAVLSYYCPGRPDHHGLLLLLFVLFGGFVLRQIEQPLSIATCLGGGAIGAMSLWLSVEAEVMIGVSVLVLALLWVIRDGDFLAKNLDFHLSLFALTCVALVLERPWSNWFAAEFDRISIVHCCLLGLIALSWGMLSLLDRRLDLLRRRAGRLVALVLAAAASAGIIWSLFPGFYRGPLANVDPRALSLWLRHNAELQPLLSRGDVSAVPVIGALVLCVPFLVAWTVRRDRRAMWAYVSALLLAFVLLSFREKRWTAYAQTVLVLPIAQLVVHARTWMDTRFRGGVKTLLKSLVAPTCFVLLAFSGVPGTAPASQRGTDTAGGQEDISLVGICEHLENSALWRNQCRRIVTHIYWGSEILYRTRHAVVGTGYHRDANGILDTYAILTAEKDEDAFHLIQARGIDTILLLRRPDSVEGRYYTDADASTFYRRLCDGHLPNWCREVPLPGPLAGSFRLFEIPGI